MALKYVRQIVTKAVVAKGKKRAEACETLRPPNNPSSILGCWVINHSHQAKKHGKFVEVSGKYDINVWYAHHEHSKTAVFSETIPYKERIKLHYRDEDVHGAEDVHVRVIQQPNCTEAIITPDGELFKVTVERELHAEVVGETTVVIQVQPQDVEEEWSYKNESSSSTSTLDESSSSSSSSS